MDSSPRSARALISRSATGLLIIDQAGLPQGNAALDP
jgi:hypothetical protein